MEVLQHLGVALGLATLAGINLYLTVFVVGLAIRMDWVTLAPPFQDLAVLGHPVIIGIAGFLYLVEFFADKIPWVDSAWDSVHTLIRPVGAAALAVAALGNLHPVFEIAAALLAGGLALTSHTAKAGTRLAANSSPEPFSNIGLSLAEDGVVLGGLALIAWNPLLALLVVIVFTAAVAYILPRLIRGIRAKIWLAFEKLNAPAYADRPTEPATHLPHAHEKILRRSHSGNAPIAWAAECLSARVPRVPSNVRGWLVGLEGEPDEVFFVARLFSGGVLIEIATANATATAAERFLGSKLTIEDRSSGANHAFVFETGSSRVAARIAERIGKADDPAADSAEALPA